LYGTELASHPHASLTRAAGFILAGVLTGLLAVGHVRMGFGLSPFRSGLLLLATATGNLGMKLFATPILRRFGFRAVATVNGSIGAVCILEASTLWSVAQQMTIGMGIAFGALCLRLSGSDSAPFALADFHWAFAAASVLALFGDRLCAACARLGKRHRRRRGLKARKLVTRGYSQDSSAPGGP